MSLTLGILLVGFGYSNEHVNYLVHTYN